jgi:hypothetical protein
MQAVTKCVLGSLDDPGHQRFVPGRCRIVDVCGTRGQASMRDGVDDDALELGGTPSCSSLRVRLAVSWALTIAPRMATPTTLPNCRLVLTIAAAIPERSAGTVASTVALTATSASPKPSHGGQLVLEPAGPPAPRPGPARRCGGGIWNGRSGNEHGDCSQKAGRRPHPSASSADC